MKKLASLLTINGLVPTYAGNWIFFSRLKLQNFGYLLLNLIGC